MTLVAIFGREVIGREVVDRTGALLGHLKDIHFDLNTGMLSDLVVSVEATVDPSALPFEHDERTVKIPSSSISRIAAKIHLNQ